MHPSLKSVGLTLLLVGSTTIALCVPAPMGRSLVLSQSTTTQDRKAEADRLFEQGTNQQGQNQNESAIASFQQALNIYRELKDRQSEGKTLKSIGVIYFNLKDYPKAIVYYQQALDIARDIKDLDLESRALNNLGLAYQYAGNLTKSIDYFQPSLAVAQNSQNHFMVLLALENLAAVYRDLKQPEKAIAFLQKGVTVARQTSNPGKAAKFLAAIGSYYDDLKQHQQAIAAYQEALPLARKTPDKAQEAIILGSLGDIYKKQSNYQQALDFYRQAVTVARESNDKPLAANILSAMAYVYFLQNDFDRRIEFEQQALSLRRETTDESAQLSSLVQLSQYHYQRGSHLQDRGMSATVKADYARTIEFAQAALPLARKLKDPKLEARALAVLGNAYVSLQDYTQAETILQQAAKLARENQVWTTEALALSGLSTLYITQGNTRKQLEIQLQSVENARKQDKHEEALALINLANAYATVGDNQKAVEVFQQALIVTRQIDMAQVLPMLREGVLTIESYVLTGLILSYRVLGEFDHELATAQELYQRAQTLHRPDLEAWALIQLAASYNDFNHFSQAVTVSQQALTAARQVKNKRPDLEAQALATLSDAHSKQGNYALAMKAAEQSLTIARQLEDPLLEKNALTHLSQIYNKQGNYPKALEYAQEQLAVVQKAKLQNLEVLAWESLVPNYIAIGNTTKAMEAAQNAIALARQHHNSKDEALALEYLSQVYKARGEYDQGIETAQTALAIERQNKTFIGEVSAAAVLSEMYEPVGNYQKVIAVAEPSLVLAQKIHDRDKETELTLNLGNAYRLIGTYAKAKALLERGLKSAKELKNPRLESIALNNLGYYYVALNDFQQGLALTQQSLKIAQDLKSPPLLLSPQFNLSEIYNNLGDYAKSREFYQQALATAQQLKNRRGEGVILLAQANTYFAQGKPQETIALSQQALTIFRELKLPGLEAFANRMLSLGYGELGDDTSAMISAQAFLTFAQTVQNPVFEKDALTLLGSLNRKFGRKEQAIAAYQQALAIPRDDQVAGADSSIYGGLAKIYVDRKETGTAIAFYKQTINGIEQVRRHIEGLPPELQASFLQATDDFGHAKRSDVYRQLANLLISQGRLAEAQQVLELLKIQEIRDFNQPTRSPQKIADLALSDDEAAILKKYGTLVAFGQKIKACQDTQCAQLEQLLDQQTALVTQFNQAIRSIETSIRANRSQDDDYLDPSSQFSTAAQSIIKRQPGTVLIYPLVLDNKLWILVATEGGLLKKYEVDVSQQELGETVVALQTLLRSPNSDIKQLQATSQKLYRWLLQPLATELQVTDKNGTQTVQHLVFALDRVTRYIPMSVLFDGQHYLLEKYTVSTIIGASQTDWSRGTLSANPQQTSALALGVSEAKQGFPPLPNVPGELDAIVQRQTGDRQGVYPGLEFLNNAFTFQSLRDHLEKSKIVHIATHGAFIPGRGDDSYLLLGDGKKLTNLSIQALQGLINVDLVVLSACESALGGAGHDGVEINGFSSEFLNKGAKSVIASLWLVNDASTALLMQQFYKNLATGKMTKSEALRQAQLSLLQRKLTDNDAPQRASLRPVLPPGQRAANSASPGFSHPYYWTPFILIGNGL